MPRKIVIPSSAVAAGLLLLTATGCQVGQRVPAVTGVEIVQEATGQPVVFHTSELPLNQDPDASSGDSLSLTDAVRLAVNHAPELQAALAEVRVALAEAQQTRLLPNPILSVAVRLPSSGSSIIEASLSQELASLLTRPAQMRAADARLRAAAARSLTEALNVIAEVQEHYVAAQTAEQVVQLLEERQGLTDRLLSVSESRLKAGEGTRSDVLAVQFRRAEAAVEIAEERRNARRERLAVARLIGRPSDDANWKLSAPEEQPGPTAEDAAWVTLGLENRPEVAAITWELSALGFDRRAAGLRPFDGVEAGVDSEREEGWSVGPAASVPLPVFDWGQATRAAADARIVQAGHQLTAARRQVVQEVRQALNDFRESSAALRRVRSELLSLAEQRREQAENAYRSGLADLTDVLLAEEELQGARVKAVQLTKDVSESRIRLQRAAGGTARVPATTTPTTTGTKP